MATNEAKEAQDQAALRADPAADAAAPTQPKGHDPSGIRHEAPVPSMAQYLELFDPGMPVGAQWVEVDMFALRSGWMPGQAEELKALILYRYQNAARFPWPNKNCWERQS
jgi:hypothetical protein